MKISNVDKFEEKLRRVESELHIDPASRILISYTRNRFVKKLTKLFLSFVRWFSQWPGVIFVLSTILLLFAFIKSRVKMNFVNPMDMMVRPGDCFE